MAEHCTANSKRTGLPCKGWAINGHHVCYYHGGTLPNVKIAAARNYIISKTAQQMKVYGVPVNDKDPFETLLEEISRTSGHVRWLEAKIAGLNEEALIWGKTLQESSTGDDPKGNYEVTKHEATPHVWLQLYHKERAHLVNVCKVAIGAGIAERQVKLAEDQGALIVKIMQLSLNDIGLTPDQSDAAKRSIGRHLRLLSGGEDPIPAIQ